LADPTNPYRLDHGDSPSITLVADLLTTENYTTWSHNLLLDLWNRCNDMVVSWIQNSITPSLKSSVAFVDDAYEIWLDLHERLSHQNHDSVSIYYGNLKTLWDEMAIYDPLPTCTCGAMKALLDRSHCDQIMLLDPLPLVSKFFSLVQQQERHHQITSHLQPSETALAVKKPYNPSKPSPKNQPNLRKDRPFCTHCKISGHTIERCYKLNGYPPGHKFHTK
ncbi:hypothetical protein I3843_07G068500, partial [Carya illinoinensis]